MGKVEWDWDELCLELSRLIFNMPNDIPEAHWITITNDTPGQESRLEEYKMWKKTIWENAQYQAKNGRNNPAATLTQSSFYLDVAIACADGTFFSTVPGRIGLGPRKRGLEYCFPAFPRKNSTDDAQNG
jgi:hypothetical protein